MKMGCWIQLSLAHISSATFAASLHDTSPCTAGSWERWLLDPLAQQALHLSKTSEHIVYF